MRSPDEIRTELAEAKERVADLLRTEYESLPAEEQDGFLDEVAAAEIRLRELQDELDAAG